jgi:hypothetical protein
MSDGAAPAADRHDVDDEDARFSFSLPFAAGRCPVCGDLGAPGRCVQCGGTVPDSAEDLDVTRARIAALTPLLSEAKALEAAFDDIVRGNTVISADQFNAVVADLDLYGLLAQITGLGHALEALDFDDAKATGSTTRDAVRRYVNDVAKLLEVCREMAWFDPEGPGRRFQEHAIATGRWGAGLVRATLETLVAPTLADANAAGVEMQRFYDGFSELEDSESILAAVAEAARPDLDSRLELVLGRSGPFTDELGFVDLTAVFGAFEDEDKPLTALDAVARRYLTEYIAHWKVGSGAAVLLALPIVALAGLDRPLLAHRLLRAAIAQFDAAFEADFEATVQLLRDTGADSGIVLGGFNRAQNGLRLLALGERAGAVDDDTALAQVLNAYREIAEAPFRTYGWACLRLHGLVNDVAIEAATPPTVGELEQRLSGSGDELLTAVASASDSALRNAAAHSQYRWDGDTLELHDLRTDQRWTLEELTVAVEDLYGAVFGLDAALACVSVRDDVAGELDNPAARADVRELVAVLARGLFAAQGLRVLDLTNDLADVVIDADRVSVRQAIPVLGGLAVLVSEETKRIVLRDRDGEPLLSVAVSDLRDVAQTQETVRDIALGILSARIDPSERTSAQVAGLVVALVVTPALIEVADGVPDPTFIPRLIGRLEYALSVPEAAQSPAAPTLRKAISAAYHLRSGDGSQATALVIRLVRLQEWAAEQGLRDFD